MGLWERKARQRRRGYLDRMSEAECYGLVLILCVAAVPLGALLAWYFN